MLPLLANKKKRRKKNLDNGEQSLSDVASGENVSPVISSVSANSRGRCDYVTERYEKLGRRLGQGTYGIVYLAKDRQTGCHVALKRCIPHHEASDGFPITTLREIQSLRLCARHDNIVQLKNVAVSRSGVFLVFEHCAHDLSKVVDAHFTKHRKSPFSAPNVKTLLIHLLRAVDFMHEKHLIHRDIKLSNLLYTQRGMLKLADFGLSRNYADELQSELTPNVASLWYRAPELLLGAKSYGLAIDLWAVGCISGEITTGKPLMQGKTELDQIHEVFDCVGLPNPKCKFFSNLPLIQNEEVKLPNKSRRKLLDLLGNLLSRSGLEMVHSLLQYEPDLRWSAAKCLESTYFRDPPLPTEPRDMPHFPSSFHP